MRLALFRRGPGIGDAIAMRYILRSIKDKYPNSHLTVACMKEYFSAYEDHPAVDEVIWYRLAKTMQKSYDHFWDCSRVCNLEDRRLGSDSFRHRAEIWGEVCGVKPSDSAEIQLDPDLVEEAESRKPKNKPWCLFAPLASVEARSLDKERIAKWYDHLTKDYHVSFLSSEASDYFPAGASILRAESIPSLFALVSAADGVATVDTGIFHIATALQVPTLGFFGPTNGHIVGKLANKVEILQGPCPDKKPCYCWQHCPHSKSKHKPCMSIEPN